MNDRAVAVFEKYDFELFGTRKGRGMLIAGTDQGEVALKEYRGSQEKLEWQEAFTNSLKKEGFPTVDGLFRDKEGNLVVRDYEGTCYIVKEFLAGKECNVMDLMECTKAAAQIARMHLVMRQMMEKPLFIRRIVQEEEPEEAQTLNETPISKETQDSEEDVVVEKKPVRYEQIPVEEVEMLRDMMNRTRPGFILYESAKRKSELVRARQFIRRQSSKNDFDLLFLKEFDRFFKQAESADAYLSHEEYQILEEKVKNEKLHCHGDCNHHNILFSQGQIFIQNLEKCRPDLQMKDLYLFVRKVCEKNQWSILFATACVDAYQKVLPLSKEELKYLYTRFWYPEKFWKIANGYMNHKKSLPPRRQKEKLQALLEKEPERMTFLENFQKYYEIQ